LPFWPVDDGFLWHFKPKAWMPQDVIDHLEWMIGVLTAVDEMAIAHDLGLDLE
jgi:hypothetical protein